jgi:hypothetical protein
MLVAKKQKRPQNAIPKEYVERLGCLMAEYGIEEGDYFGLALRLAIDHVPGFEPAPLKLKHGTWGAVVRDNKGGRPTNWTLEQLDALVTDVDNAKKKYNFSTDEDALKHIAKSGKWARFAHRDPDKRIKTLKNLIGRARKIQSGVDDLFARLEEIRRENPEN